MDSRPDPYRVLGVPPTATAEQLTRAYRELARRLHPDGGSDAADADRFGELAEAYAAVSDPARRAEHDRRAHERRGPAASTAVRVPVRRVVRRRRGADLRVPVHVPLALAVLGGPVEVDLPGRGRQRVRLPAGADDGDVVRVPGCGRDGSDGGPPGDLLVCVAVEPDSRFTRAGDDVATTVRVRWPDAVLGAELQIQALDRRVPVRLPPGTASGIVLRVGGHGVPGRGDLLVTVEVEVPGELDDDERAAVQQLAAVLRPGRP